MQRSDGANLGPSGSGALIYVLRSGAAFIVIVAVADGVESNVDQALDQTVHFVDRMIEDVDGERLAVGINE